MKKLVVAFMAMMMITSTMLGSVYAISFSDLPTTHWAYANITKLVDDGVVSGYPDGTFRPSGTITRGEFTKLLVLTIFGQSYDKVLKKDGYEHWALPYVRTAELRKILAEDEFTINNINEPITRIEMVRMVSRADIHIRKSDMNVEGELPFSDTADLGETDKLLLLHAVSRKLLEGNSDGTFAPDHNMTRAQAATVIYRYTMQGFERNTTTKPAGQS